jgi:PPM family protein phosphatase
MEAHESAPASGVRTRDVQIQVAVATHIGRRTTNADAFVLDEVAGLYAVSDGMGDTLRSSLIAQMALAAVREVFREPWVSYAPAERSVDEAKRRILLGVEQAHGRLLLPWWARGERIGTTFAGVVVCGEHLVIGHVGDSRVYLLRASKGRLTQLTQDHTVAGNALGRGTPADAAARLPNADALTQMIGMRRFVGLRPIVRRWEPGDIALLCTDGVSNRLGADVLADVVLDSPEPGEAAQRLVDHAIQAGGGDNATVVLVHRTT